MLLFPKENGPEDAAPKQSRLPKQLYLYAQMKALMSRHVFQE